MVDEKRSANLSPKSFRETPLCELCFEDALKAGSTRSEKVKPADFTETSIRFCVDGLRDWYSSFVKSYCDCSLRTAIRDISWQWASFCENNTSLVNVRGEFLRLRQEITEKTAYTDLVERMRQQVNIKEFDRTGSAYPCNIDLPTEAAGIISETGEALGINFSRFLQVGLAWSLSTNRQGLYTGWVEAIQKPLFTAVMVWAERKVKDLEEVRFLSDLRLSQGISRSVLTDQKAP